MASRHKAWLQKVVAHIHENTYQKMTTPNRPSDTQYYSHSYRSIDAGGYALLKQASVGIEKKVGPEDERKDRFRNLCRNLIVGGRG